MTSPHIDITALGRLDIGEAIARLREIAGEQIWQRGRVTLGTLINDVADRLEAVAEHLTAEEEHRRDCAACAAADRVQPSWDTSTTRAAQDALNGGAR